MRALESSLDTVARQYPDFQKKSGGFTEAYLSSSAVAGQLARVFVAGEKPNVRELIETWVSWHADTGAPKVIEARRQIAVEPMKCLVTEWSQRIRGLGAFEEQARRVDFARTADGIEQLVKALSAEQAEDMVLDEYLRRVIRDHRWLDTTGIGVGNRQIPLEDVFVFLSALEENAPRDGDRYELDQRRAALEAALRSKDIDKAEFDRQLDDLLRNPNRVRDGEPRSLVKKVAGSDRLVVLGEPGSGKTTMLYWLARNHAEAILNRAPAVSGDGGDWSTPARFPIYVRVGSLVAVDGWKGLSIEELIWRDLRARSYPNPTSLQHLIDSQLRRGRCVILFDAVDEIQQASDRRLAARRIQEFSRTWSNLGNRIIATSRRAGYYSAPIAGFEHCQTMGMLPDEVDAFLAAYFKALERVGFTNHDNATIRLGADCHIRDLTESIQGNRRVARLAANPLLLTILASVQLGPHEIPTKRIIAYQKAVGALEQGWRSQNVDSAALPDEHLLRSTMSSLAWWVHRHRPAGVVTSEDIIDAIGSTWAEQRGHDRLGDGRWPDVMRSEIKSFVELIEQHCGLLIEHAPQRWAFAHPNFQEYYVAAHILRQPKPAETMRHRLHDPRYREPILLALNLLTHGDPDPDAASVTEATVFGTGPMVASDSVMFEPSQYEDLIGRDRQFAFEAAADDVNLPPRVVSDLAKLAKKRILDQEYDEETSRFVQSLAQTATGSVLASDLQSDLHSIKTTVGNRIVIAEALGLLGETSIAEGALRDSAKSSTIRINHRCAAARALGRLGEIDLAAEVLRAIADANGAPIEERYKAARALGDLGDASDETIEVLHSVAVATQIAVNVRRAAIQSLGRLGDTGVATSNLLRSLIGQSGENASVRRSAAEALGRSGDTGPETPELLRRVANGAETDPDVKCAAAEALGKLGETRSAAEVLRSIAADSTVAPTTRLRSAQALSSRGDSRSAGAAMISIAANSDAATEVRRSAVGALVRSRDITGETVELLRAMVSDFDDSTGMQVVAAEALIQIGFADDETAHILRSVAGDLATSTNIRIIAAKALGNMGHVHIAAEVLRAILRVTTIGSDVRCLAARELGQLNSADTETADLLHSIAGSRQTDTRVRRFAAEALGHLGELRPPWPFTD